MPSTEAVELVLNSIPGVASAALERESDRRTSLRVRIEDGHEPGVVAGEVSRTLRERFGINLSPESLLRPPPEPSPSPPESTPSSATAGATSVVAQPPIEALRASDDDRTASARPPRDHGERPSGANVPFRVPRTARGEDHWDVRLVDASIDGEGLGRRAVVVINQTGPNGVQTAMGATLVGSSDALAVASATLQALGDLA